MQSTQQANDKAINHNGSQRVKTWGRECHFRCCHFFVRTLLVLNTSQDWNFKMCHFTGWSFLSSPRIFPSSHDKLIKTTWCDHLPIDGAAVESPWFFQDPDFLGPWFFQDTILSLLILWLCQVHPTDCTLAMDVRFWRLKSHWMLQDPRKNFTVLDTVPVRDLVKRQETAEWQWEKRFEWTIHSFCYLDAIHDLDWTPQHRRSWNCDGNGSSLLSGAPTQFPRLALIQDQVRPMFSHDQRRSYLRHGTNQAGRS